MTVRGEEIFRPNFFQKRCSARAEAELNLLRLQVKDQKQEFDQLSAHTTIVTRQITFFRSTLPDEDYAVLIIRGAVVEFGLVLAVVAMALRPASFLSLNHSWRPFLFDQARAHLNFQFWFSEICS